MEKDHIDVAKYLLKLLKNKVDDAIIEVELLDATQIKFSNSRISAIQKWNTLNAVIFASINKRIISTTVTDVTEQSASHSISNMLEFSKSIAPNKEYEGIAKGPFSYRKIEEGFDKKIEALGEDAVEIVEQGIGTAENNGAKRTAGVFETTTGDSYILSTNDVEASEKSTSAYFSLRAFTDKDASGHNVGCSRLLKKLNVKEISAKASKTAEMARNPKDGAAGNFDVVFAPLPYANLLEIAGNSASAFTIDSGLSFFKNMLNKKVANPAFTLTDDPTLPNGFLSTPFDAEGFPSQKKNIIDKGILKTYLHNTSTAKKYKTKTTGNAGLLSPDAFNLVLQPGKLNEERLIEQVQNGIFITNLWYTRFANHITGDFSTIPRDGMFYIKNGRISHPIKNIRISDNMQSILKNTSIIGNNVESIHGWEVSGSVITPSVLTKNVKVTKPE